MNQAFARPAHWLQRLAGGTARAMRASPPENPPSSSPKSRWPRTGDDADAGHVAVLPLAVIDEVC